MDGKRAGMAVSLVILWDEYRRPMLANFLEGLS